MGRIHRYRTAWRRHRRSKGFGIHSPFAFNFVLNVLRERLPYYNYAYLHQLRQAIVGSLSTFSRHPRVMSYKNAKMLFRIANFFQPRHILQIGTCYGYSAASVLSVSRSSRLYLYEPQLDRFPGVGQVLQPFLDFVQCYNSLDVAVGEYNEALADGLPFVVVGHLPESDRYDDILNLLLDVMRRHGTFILRNISRDKLMKRLWLDCQQRMPYGHSYSNEKLAVFVAQPHLPKQHFLLWF